MTSVCEGEQGTGNIAGDTEATDGDDNDEDVKGAGEPGSGIGDGQFSDVEDEDMEG